MELGDWVYSYQHDMFAEIISMFPALRQGQTYPEYRARIQPLNRRNYFSPIQPLTDLRQMTEREKAIVLAERALLGEDNMNQIIRD